MNNCLSGKAFLSSTRELLKTLDQNIFVFTQYCAYDLCSLRCQQSKDKKYEDNSPLIKTQNTLLIKTIILWDLLQGKKRSPPFTWGFTSDA